METFAFTQIAVSYEDPNPASLREFDVQLPKIAATGIAGSAMVFSSMVVAPDAHAAVRFGDKCDGVYKVQNELAFNGFLAESGKDGSFGPQTQAAVIQFQRAHGLFADGIVGTSTAAKLGIPVPSCAGGGGDESPSGPKVSTPSGRPLNVRATPNGAIVGSLDNGAAVSLTSARQSAGGYVWAQLSGGNWIAVQYVQ